MSGTPTLSKSEIRNPKPEGNPKPENIANGHIFRILAFGFLSDFGLRISGFGRIRAASDWSLSSPATSA